LKNPDDQALHKLLAEIKTIAVIGLSDKPHRASYRVASYMQNKGYRIIPVNPRLKQVLGETVYPNLALIPDPVDLVNVFRKSEDVPLVMEEALPMKPRAIWLQLGISHPGAAAAAREEGVLMIMDCCLMVKHRQLFPEPVEPCGCAKL
jgi:predicted CoA-binding protein